MANFKPHGRLAPSPTGLLHLGNAFAFWMAWLDVRSRHGHLTLRMEDIDPDRAKPAFAEAVRCDLQWLGLDWDAEAPPQSTRGAVYEKILADLAARGLSYPCYCTRKELRSLAGAPQVGDAGAPYPGACRRLSAEQRQTFEAQGRKSSLRLLCPPDTPWIFTDRVCGPLSMTLAGCGGDFALRRSDRVFAYQLAVVADDIAARISSVVRGNDILTSTPRQLYLYSLLNAEPPQYAHLPLVCDHQGDRLAKRHHSLTLSALREAGVRPETILGALFHFAGLSENFRPLSAADVVHNFTIETIPNRPIYLPENPLDFFLRIQNP